MALRTAILRDDQNLTLPHGWGWWHVECMNQVDKAESGTLHSTGEHVVQATHTFTDPADGEVLTLLPGDTLKMWRDR